MFAPADFAFESIGITNETVLTFDLDLLSSVLSYHVVPNEAVDNSTLRGPLREFQTLLSGRALRNSLDGGVLDGTGMKASVLAADLQAVNGYLHAIDIVLEWYPLFTQSPTSAPTATPTLLDLVDTLAADNADRGGEYFGQFDTMIAALSVSELDLELEQPGPFTVGWISPPFPSSVCFCPFVCCVRSEFGEFGGDKCCVSAPGPFEPFNTDSRVASGGHGQLLSSKFPSKPSERPLPFLVPPPPRKHPRLHPTSA